MSNAEEIRKQYKQCLMDGQPHSREELFSFVKEHDNGTKYTEGMLSGALKTLIDKEKEYIQVERAIYQFVEGYQQDIISQYISIFENMLTNIDKVSVDPFSLLEELNKKDKEKMEQIKNCIEEVRKIIVSLQVN